MLDAASYASQEGGAGLPSHFSNCSPTIASPGPSQSSYLTVVIVSICAHQVDTVTVLIPESPFVGQGTVGDGRVCVLVVSGEGPAIVVCHGVT